jgi:hypothetical protein
MPSSTFSKFNSFVEDVAEKVHNLGSDTLRLALSNTAPVATNTTLSNITEIVYSNLSGNPTSRNLTVTLSAQTSGTYTLDANDVTLTATGGALPTFRYVVVYNSSSGTAGTERLIGWYDYGSGGLTLASGESLTITFDVLGILTLA